MTGRSRPLAPKGRRACSRGQGGQAPPEHYSGVGGGGHCSGAGRREDPRLVQGREARKTPPPPLPSSTAGKARQPRSPALGLHASSAHQTAAAGGVVVVGGALFRRGEARESRRRSAGACCVPKPC